MSYDDIKKQLSDMYSMYIDNGRTNEHFSLDHLPKPDSPLYSELLNNPNVPVELRKSIVPSELYNVIQKFDLEPSQLTQQEKELRIKYLDIMSKTIIDNYSKLNLRGKPEIVLKNVDSSKNLILRIIKLLKKEVQDSDITAAPSSDITAAPSSDITAAPSSELKYMIIISVLLVALFVALFMLYKK